MIQYGKSKYSAAAPECVVKGDKWRFSVLTERMIRMEYSESGSFVDRQTQKVLDRRFDVPEFSVSDSENKLEIVTKYLIVTYDKKPFSLNGLTVQMRGNPYLRKTGIWFYGDGEFLRMGNLGGTTETLDNAVGDTYYRDSADECRPWGEPDKKVELCDGILSKNGFSVIDDSGSLVFEDDGWVTPGPADHTDIYFLSYGRDYLGCLKDFYHLTGATPMLPRYALGNWWSRYHSYTQEEYMELMDRFRRENIPIAVAIQDMGWHYVDIDPKYGKGWTGYTWNRELFPDPAAMMRELHQQGKHVTLNVHPADGVRAHEEMYPEMAAALGVDAEHESPIPFDVTDRKFMEAYFKYLHHPNEEMGVDFWWLDWQQGSNTRVPGYDPLWMLNHFHYVDNARSGKRPLDFSRFAGLGSHRYPIGFSGSTFITWESLDYQPWFTATASNAGYGWWSHDIGGHRNGYRDDELTARWVQFGVFSPIMRLHSSNEVFTGKEPWKFCADTERTMRFFLTLRHRLLPYTYTMNRRFSTEGEPIVQPVYYRHPTAPEAYQIRNEYFFGSELLVNPITSHTDEKMRMGSVVTWLPEGTWYDVFTGLRYTGSKRITMFRSIDTIPVLAKAGSIVPLQSAEEVSDRTDNPAHLELCVFAGKSGDFTLYEDDGVSNEFENGRFVTTRFALDEENKTFIIEPAEGDVSLIPEKRRYTLKIYGVKGEGAGFDEKRNVLTVECGEHCTDERITVSLNLPAAENNVSEYAYEIINRAQFPFSQKERLYKLITGGKNAADIVAEMQTMPIGEAMTKALSEIILA